jgi:predicted permease
LQVFVILVQNIGNFTLGVFLISSAKTPGWRALAPVLRQTAVWSVAIALTIRGLYGPIQPDMAGMRWLWVPLKYFHDGLVAVALVTLGVQLSKTRATAALPRLGPALALRLLGGPLVACALAPLFAFEGELAKTMILSASFPTAVNTALLAHEFKADTEYAAGAVFWSTLLSMITVTVLITILKASP